MSVTQAQRNFYRRHWRDLVAEALACAEDASRPVQALKAQELASRSPRPWVAPNGDPADVSALGALQAACAAYARQANQRDRLSLQVALARLAHHAATILGEAIAPAGAAAEEPETPASEPSWRTRADIGDRD